MQPGDMFANFRLLSLLGVGGMGQVWKAQDCGLAEREVAIKVVRPGTDQAFLGALASEARTLAKTPIHKNVVVLFGVVEAEEAFGLVMEYIPGAALTDLLRDHPRGLPWDVAYEVFQALFDGVGHAHRNRVIHRDLKPDNVRIAHYRKGRPISADEVKILDFGLARIEKQLNTKFTRSAAGTLTYMSPEQIKEDRQEPYTDVYALGVILYEALVGRPPFGGPGQDSFSALVQAHCELAPPPPSLARRGLAGPLEEAIFKAMAKDSSQRFQSADAMGQAVLPLLQANACDPSLQVPSRLMETMDMALMDEDPAPSRPRSRSRNTVTGAAPSLAPTVPSRAGSRASASEARKGALAFLLVLAAAGGLGGYGFIHARQEAQAEVLRAFHIPEVLAIPGGIQKSSTCPSVAVAPFKLARTPVTVEQFRAFVKATGYEAGSAWDRPGKESHPVTSVSHDDAEAYVQWLGTITRKAWYLPSEAEYEFAASNGGHPIPFPWGSGLPEPMDNPHGNFLRPEGGPCATVPVGSYPPNDFGLLDMIGNAWEWTSTANEKGEFEAKGGGWDSPADRIGITIRSPLPRTFRNNHIGFRVAQR